MFNFGLFSSHIPYLVIAIVYSVFLLTMSVDRIKEQTSIANEKYYGSLCIKQPLAYNSYNHSEAGYYTGTPSNTNNHLHLTMASPIARYWLPYIIALSNNQPAIQQMPNPPPVCFS